MNNSLTATRTHFSGKMALVAAIIFGFAISSQAQANQLTPSEQAAVQKHFEILNLHQQASDNQIIDNIQADLDTKMDQAEVRFMKTACAEYDRQYDNDTQVCY